MPDLEALVPQDSPQVNTQEELQTKDLFLGKLRLPSDFEQTLDFTERENTSREYKKEAEFEVRQGETFSYRYTYLGRDYQGEFSSVSENISYNTQDTLNAKFLHNSLRIERVEAGTSVDGEPIYKMKLQIPESFNGAVHITTGSGEAVIFSDVEYIAPKPQEIEREPEILTENDAGEIESIKVEEQAEEFSVLVKNNPYDQDPPQSVLDIGESAHMADLSEFEITRGVEISPEGGVVFPELGGGMELVDPVVASDPQMQNPTGNNLNADTEWPTEVPELTPEFQRQMQSLQNSSLQTPFRNQPVSPFALTPNPLLDPNSPMDYINGFSQAEGLNPLNPNFPGFRPSFNSQLMSNLETSTGPQPQIPEENNETQDVNGVEQSNQVEPQKEYEIISGNLLDYFSQQSNSNTTQYSDYTPSYSAYHINDFSRSGQSLFLELVNSLPEESVVHFTTHTPENGNKSYLVLHSESQSLSIFYESALSSTISSRIGDLTRGRNPDLAPERLNREDVDSYISAYNSDKPVLINGYEVSRDEKGRLIIQDKSETRKSDEKFILFDPMQIGGSINVSQYDYARPTPVLRFGSPKPEPSINSSTTPQPTTDRNSEPIDEARVENSLEGNETEDGAEVRGGSEIRTEVDFSTASGNLLNYFSEFVARRHTRGNDNMLIPLITSIHLSDFSNLGDNPVASVLRSMPEGDVLFNTEPSSLGETSYIVLDSKSDTFFMFNRAALSTYALNKINENNNTSRPQINPRNLSADNLEQYMTAYEAYTPGAIPPLVNGYFVIRDEKGRMLLSHPTEQMQMFVLFDPSEIKESTDISTYAASNATEPRRVRPSLVRPNLNGNSTSYSGSYGFTQAP